jgi:catechol 2,3-dioxygenase-like lactoylglutathione lyase family enzyme
MILDHIGLAVSDYEKSKTFFARALAPLRIELVMEVQGGAGLGRDGHNIEAVCHQPVV